MTLSLLSTCSWCVVRVYTWLSLCLSLLSTCSWCVVRAYTWLSLCLSLLSTCSWCVVSALAPLSCGSRRIIQVDAAHWWWLRRPPPPHMSVKCFGCTTIHKKRYINASFINLFMNVLYHWLCIPHRAQLCRCSSACSSCFAHGPWFVLLAMCLFLFCACVLHWLHAFMLSCLVWVFSLAACSTDGQIQQFAPGYRHKS